MASLFNLKECKNNIMYESVIKPDEFCMQIYAEITPHYTTNFKYFYLKMKNINLGKKKD